ncbi:DUF3828 domain-containing protein [Cyanobium sp. CH-040]|uniref:DUF3828 domain-containing protein n=1 Tax=Cyanobium sp. CH-040 TaxID=2823708 RepID=UPI0020CD0251|nr:DUF3828 domain-containing protein [Cyanobium sp. CH-040]
MLLALAPLSTAGAGPVPCPAALTAQIDGLYRWQVARQDASGAIDLTSQRERFTPALYQQLDDAFRLSPADGRFVDSDVFSGTQVRTFGARVLGCAPAGQDSLEAQVSVEVGLLNRPSGTPVQLRYRMQPTGTGAWRIADISYPGEPGFTLTRFLSELLESPNKNQPRR